MHQKAPRGRPKGHPEFKIQQTFRVKESLDAMIRESAEVNLRSISEELEFRVDRSFNAVSVKPALDLMTHLRDEGLKNGRTVEEEALHRLTSAMASDKAIAAIVSGKVVEAIASQVIQKLVKEPG